jgi:stage V sporulation protein AE
MLFAEIFSPEKLIYSFIFGGIICVLAQLLIDLTRLTPARILVILVSTGVLLFAIGIYKPMFDIFGAGISVPLIGFGANIAKGVRDAIDSEGIIGILTGGLSSSSAGITVALLAGFLSALLFKTKSKRM